MRETKREWMPLYSFLDRGAIAAHLADMAAEGWLLKSIGSFRWTYEKTEPKRLKFAVAYFGGAGAYSPAPAAGLDTFRDYCAEAGWQLAAGWDQVQIFYNEDPDAIPLETDPEVELGSIEKSFGKPMVKSQLLLLALALFQSGFQLFRLWDDPVEMLSSNTNLLAMTAYFPIVLITAVNLICYFRWRKTARAAVQAGGAVPDMPSAKRMSVLILVWSALMIAAVFASIGASPGMLLFMVCFMAAVALMAVAANKLRKYLQKRRWPAWANIAAMLGLCALFFVAGMAGIFTAIPIMASSNLFAESQPVETYELDGWTWEVYADDIPLRVEDLADVDYDRWSTEARLDSSLLAFHGEYRQDARLGDGQWPDIRYEIVTVNVPFLLDWCKQDYIRWVERGNEDIPAEYRAEYWEEYRPIDPILWGADEVLRRYTGSEPVNQFLLVWPDRLAEIHLPWDWELTAEQMAVIGEKLGSE